VNPNPLPNAVFSAALQLLVLGVLPCIAYGVYRRRRYRRSWSEVRLDLGFALGPPRYLAFALAGCALVAAVSYGVATHMPRELLAGDRSPHRTWFAAGVTSQTAALAALYAVVKTGLTEELLFRGLVAGALSRRLSLGVANVAQTAIFLAPHVPVAFVAPSAAALTLGSVTVMSLLSGWLRIRSGSMVGAWWMHATANLVTAYVAATSSPSA